MTVKPVGIDEDGNLPPRARTAIAASPEVKDTVAGEISTPGTETRQALDATFVARDEPGFDIVVLLGQSNMDGRGTSYNLTTDPADSRVYVLAQSGTYAGQIIQATEPLPGYVTPSGMGPGLNFARWYASEISPTRRVLLLPVAKGGVPFEGSSSPSGFTWKVGRNDVTNLWANAAAKVTEALALAGEGARVAVALMVHGESDGDNATSGATYQADLDTLIGALRSHVGWSVPVVLGQMVPEYLGVGTRAAINTVQAATPTRLDAVRFATGPVGETKNDGNHYESGGARKLGRSLFAAYMRLMKGVPDPALPAVPAQVTGLSASNPTSSTIDLTWSAAARATVYLIERRLTSGGSWSRVGTTTGLASNPSGLAEGTSYDWRVTALNAAGPGVASATYVAATSSAAPLLDAVAATAFGAYSTRKLRASYSGSAIRVRRSSDNTEQDIGFSSGILDTAALATFIGAGSGYIAKWYDQSAGGHDLAMATTAAQPRIASSGVVDAIGSRPAVQFDGTDDYLLASATGLYAAGALTVAAVVSGPAASAARLLAEGSSAGNNPQYAPVAQATAVNGQFTAFLRNDANTIVLSDNGGAVGSAWDGTPHQLTSIDSGSQSTQFRDGTQTQTRAYTRAGTLTVDRLAVGALARVSVAAFLSGALGELVVFTSALNSTDRGTVEASQKGFFGTP